MGNASPTGTHYLLTLYVAGASPRSASAIEELRAALAARAPETFELRVVDVRHDSSSVATDDVLAVPTLVKHLPLPVQRFVGDLLSHRFLVGVGIESAEQARSETP